MTKIARILIVDDHPMMREGLTIQISAQPDMEVSGEADDLTTALEQVKTTSPDLAIIDISLKNSHGIELIKDIKGRYPNVKMLVLSAYQESLYAERALRAGAMGFLNKQETREKIFDAIRTVLAGDRYLSAEMTQRLVSQAIAGSDTTTKSPVETLSNRELEVFQLIGEGISTSEIASRLHLSVHTIDTHREKLKSKLKIRSAGELQREATQWLLENG